MGFWNRKNGFFRTLTSQLTTKFKESCFLFQDETRWRKKYPQGGWGWDRRQNEFRSVVEAMSIITFMVAVKMQNIDKISKRVVLKWLASHQKSERGNFPFLRCFKPQPFIAITSERWIFKTKPKRTLYNHCDQRFLAPNWPHFKALIFSKAFHLTLLWTGKSKNEDSEDQDGEMDEVSLENNNEGGSKKDKVLILLIFFDWFY